MKYKTIIGLEIHAQLMTKSKMFCSCSSISSFNKPNTNICPICTGQPGVLPMLNEKAVELAVKASLALNCRINRFSSFDRKNYFYPDLPKGYQITQFFSPIAENGYAIINTGDRKKRIGIKRIHMEEDAGKMNHDYHGNVSDSKSRIDYNRSGMPLIEIVTEPDIDSPEEAYLFMETVRNILKYIKVCSGDLEKGALRCDANISLRHCESSEKTGRVEVKNVNSFRFVQKALEYEEERLKKLFLNGGHIFNETRGWNMELKSTFPLRKKESENDYRYFPEPDLPNVFVDEEYVEKIAMSMEELPESKLERFMYSYNMSYLDAKTYIEFPELADFFEECASKSGSFKAINNWILGEIQRYLKDSNKNLTDTSFSAVKLIQLIDKINTGIISNNIGKKILPELFVSDKSVSEIIAENKMEQITDEALLEKIFEAIIEENPEKYESYRYGKKGLLKFFIGELMKKTKGQSDPKIVREIVYRRLEEICESGK